MTMQSARAALRHCGQLRPLANLQDTMCIRELLCRWTGSSYRDDALEGAKLHQYER
ncbi:hypothetical protein DOTSEDRAFT_67872 [Dothistroma septosporum NZE10]|uniref:Uncharacterized protein n=1 Tax=Dothistroma septosporum (strain NZE10 / CBS 128990) TaxID=675120 RepID=N1Q3C3_DOTSN|nr:hypothetical protein DOTSEDRAFT_67872 [Dothistroma septosporum NZE10]